MLAAIAIGIIMLFEVGYVIAVSLPGDKVFARFTPHISAEDQAMLELSLPGVPHSKPKVKPVKQEPVTAVDASLEKAAAELAAVSNSVPTVVAKAEVKPKTKTEKEMDAVDAALEEFTAPKAIAKPEPDVEAQDAEPVG